MEVKLWKSTDKIKGHSFEIFFLFLLVFILLVNTFCIVLDEPAPPPNTYKNRFELLSCKITTTNLQNTAIFEKLLVKNSFFFLVTRTYNCQHLCVTTCIHVCMDIIFMLPICMYKHRGHGHPCLRRGTAKDTAICTL